jgi:hypothetical protein
MPYIIVTGLLLPLILDEKSHSVTSCKQQIEKLQIYFAFWHKNQTEGNNSLVSYDENSSILCLTPCFILYNSQGYRFLVHFFLPWPFQDCRPESLKTLFVFIF